MTIKKKAVQVKNVKSAPKSKETVKKIKKSVSKQSLVCADDGQCFWTNDGKIIANLLQLSEELQSMSEEVFKHHVTQDKNDFALWIHEILNDKVLAKSIRAAKDPKSAHTIILRRLKSYNV